MSEPKEHYTNWHWGDWHRDTSTLRSSTRGIWVDMIGEMARQRTDRIHAQFDKLPFVLRETQMGIMLAAMDLAENDTAIVLINNIPLLEWRNDLTKSGSTETEWITNHMAKAYLTVICRRRQKELSISEKRAAAGRKGMEARYKKDNKQANKTSNNPLSNAGNGSGSGNGIPIEVGGAGEETKEAVPPPDTSPPSPQIHPNGLSLVETATAPAFTREQFNIAGQQMAVDTTELDAIWDYLGSQGWRWSNGCGLGTDPRQVINRCMSWKERKKQQQIGGPNGNSNRNTNRPDRAEGTANAGKHDTYKRPLGAGGNRQPKTG